MNDVSGCLWALTRDSYLDEVVEGSDGEIGLAETGGSGGGTAKRIAY